MLNFVGAEYGRESLGCQRLCLLILYDLVAFSHGRLETQNARHRIDDAWAVISKDSWQPLQNVTMPM